MDAGRVAVAGHNGLQRGTTMVIPGLRNRILAFSVRLSPRGLVTKFAAYQAERHGRSQRQVVPES